VSNAPGPNDDQRPEPYAPKHDVRRFTRGRDKPRGVKWFGVQSFWGHLRHLAAVAIATEDVDSRSWMSPDRPTDLLARTVNVLGAEPRSTLTESLDRDLWIDYVADTGDDAAVSRAVAGLVFTQFRLPDPTHPGAELSAPRGDLLVFGGDTAYPVATAEEITNRVLVPWNQVLTTQPGGSERVLLGVPGNHDWYDGLDGFQRLFRHRPLDPAHGTAPTSRHSTTLIGRYATYARQFVLGGQIEKPKALKLLGYTPVQNASHFILPLAPGLVLFGVDRQLKRIDPRQRDYFAEHLNDNLAVAPWVLLPDPLYAFGDKSESGFDMLDSLGLRLHRRPQFFLAGDIHHYCREQVEASLLVTAGGGGAFLHPAPMRDGEIRPQVEFPDRKNSRRLLWQAPWKIALGRSGILPHAVLLALLLPAVLGVPETNWPWGMGAATVTVALGATLALLAGRAHTRWFTRLLAFATAAVIVSLPFALSRLSLLAAAWPVPSWALLGAQACVAVFLATLAFGTYLALLTQFGLESTQAFTALDHPGFKHFVRLRVRRDGSAVDGYCIGLVDPLSPHPKPVLVDQFTFRVRDP
jgi:hypothetical protein